MSDEDVRALWDNVWGNRVPFHGQVLNLELVDWNLEKPTVTLRMPYQASFDNAPDPEHAVLHGGVLASFADAATGFLLAVASGTLGGPTINLQVDCLAPARRSALMGYASVVKCGRKIGVATVDMIDESERLVAVGRQTCYIGG